MNDPDCIAVSHEVTRLKQYYLQIGPAPTPGTELESVRGVNSFPLEAIQSDLDAGSPVKHRYISNTGLITIPDAASLSAWLISAKSYLLISFS